MYLHLHTTTIRCIGAWSVQSEQLALESRCMSSNDMQDSLKREGGLQCSWQPLSCPHELAIIYIRKNVAR